VRDPYEGDWYLIPLSDTLLGVFGEVDEPLLEKLIKGENGAAGQGKP
jgi:hypothetical protein